MVKLLCNTLCLTANVSDLCYNYSKRFVREEKNYPGVLYMQFNIHSVITDCKVCHYAGDAEGEFRLSPSPTSWLPQSDL